MANPSSAIDFKTLEEEWGEVELEDGIVVRIRISMGFAFRPSPGALRFRYNTAVMSYWPDTAAHAQVLRGKEAKKVAKVYDQSKFKVIRQAISSYRLADGGMIQLRAEPQEFRLYNEFKDEDEPVIEAGIQVAVVGSGPIPPESAAPPATPSAPTPPMTKTKAPVARRASPAKMAG